MKLNPQKGNMYGFVTHTGNTVKGKCPDHDCLYCYMKRFPQNNRRFDEKELRIPMEGEGKFIFVGSSNDMWSKGVPAKWIVKTLFHCRNYPGHKYLFQSKNPARFESYLEQMPEQTVLGTTIETNRAAETISKAPGVYERAKAMAKIGLKFPTMVTIEPVIDFDLPEMVDLIRSCNADWVNIGADSGGNNLPEPGAGKLQSLICQIELFTVVKFKKNLSRLMR